MTYLEVTLAFLGFSRILFAWGMDRQGPKWFTDISPRWAGPIKTYTLAFAILFIGTAGYVLWFTTLFTGLAAAGMRLVSVFFVTGVSAVTSPTARGCARSGNRRPTDASTSSACRCSRSPG